VPGGYKYRNLALHAWGSLESETVKYGQASCENDCAGEDQQQLLRTDATSRQRGCYIRTVTASVSFESKNLVVGLKGLGVNGTMVE
jgi:hypothetical protein